MEIIDERKRKRAEKLKKLQEQKAKENEDEVSSSSLQSEKDDEDDEIQSVESKRVEFKIVGLWRIFFARFFDIIVSSILPLVLALTLSQWGQGEIWSTILVIVIAFVWLAIYFVAIPYFWQGRTFVKWIFQVRLVTSRKRMTLLMIVAREMFIIFIPWAVELITNFIVSVALGVDWGSITHAGDDSDSANYDIAVTVLKVVTTFYFLWYIGLILALLFNKKHQFFVDHRLDIYIVDRRPFDRNEFKKPEAKTLITRKQEHVHLAKNQPGNIDDDALKEIDDL